MRIKLLLIVSMLGFLAGIAGIVIDGLASVEGPWLWIISAALFVQAPLLLQFLRSKRDRLDRIAAARIVREYNAGVDLRKRRDV